MKKDWTYYIGASALLVGLLVEAALALSAVVFVLYEICYAINLIFNWLVNAIPVGAIPLMLGLIIFGVIGAIIYDHYHCLELAEGEDDHE